MAGAHSISAAYSGRRELLGLEQPGAVELAAAGEHRPTKGHRQP